MKNKAVYLFICLLPLACLGFKNHPKKEKGIAGSMTKRSRFLKKPPVNLQFQKIYADPNMKNLNMIGTVTKFGVGDDKGKILRVLRSKNIAEAVHVRYSWIPTNVLLAFSAQEDGGVDLLPNAANDGGFGNIHMQPLLAHKFGLHTYKGCDKMVCRVHARELKTIMLDSRGDRRKLTKLDDRLNPIYDFDAVARMLSFYQFGKKLHNLTPLQTAICRYSGSYNYKKYYGNVMKYVKLLSDQKYLASLEKEFDKNNPTLTINGTHADFKRYLALCQQQNKNYGLDTYQKIGSFK